jgi:hypothetical protein
LMMRFEDTTTRPLVSIDFDDDDENLDHPVCIRQSISTEINLDRHET